MLSPTGKVYHILSNLNASSVVTLVSYSSIFFLDSVSNNLYETHNAKKILLKFNTTEFLLNFNINISSNLINENFPSVAKEVEVIFLENKDSFTDTEWKNLYKLSENTFVEETDSLKQGAAGAGLTDND